MPELKLVSKNFEYDDQPDIKSAMSRGAYQQWKRVLSEKIPPEDIIEEVKTAKLRGQGGAGFPAGVKWGFVPKDSPKPKYLCVNADEGEPGTFKDRALLEKDPHQLLEGIAITCYAVGIHTAFIYMRGEFYEPQRIVQDAIDQAKKEGLLGENISGSGFNLEVIIHMGAGAYICGEETALLNSLEGGKGWPRLKPPFPALVGAFNCPTVINNVETISGVPHILRMGGEEFAKIGTEKDGGTKLFGVSGHAAKPGLYELPMGTSLKELIYDHAGGVRDGKGLKAVIPGGSSTPILKPDELDIPLEFEAMMDAGTMLGSGAAVVLDETVSIPQVFMVMSRFYAHESCGQCTPCREGCTWVYKTAKKIAEGNGQPSDLDLILDIAPMFNGTTVCPLGAALAAPAVAMVEKFRDEFLKLMKN
ncbi:NADH-quinone oxidoreductase subunit F [candidate division LCP-89 bacterium B3_LCP]|uniref:NADH-quinone oxidoreductase subunit F n=1 Tax=candidate division LCP-89 bacterium B3_LCP TaxID=2012998 RepID=A0A532V5E4_UNCL8|nr:MAG: NADH-quinone oxidoreductase subunit F [candidate division LCP-89 bacterium B3_LCP]